MSFVIPTDRVSKYRRELNLRWREFLGLLLTDDGSKEVEVQKVTASGDYETITPLQAIDLAISFPGYGRPPRVRHSGFSGRIILRDKSRKPYFPQNRAPIVTDYEFSPWDDLNKLALSQKKKRQWGLFIKLRKNGKTRSNPKNRLRIRVPHL